MDFSWRKIILLFGLYSRGITNTNDGRLFKRSNSNHLIANIIERCLPSSGSRTECTLKCASQEHCTTMSLDDRCCMLLSTAWGNAFKRFTHLSTVLHRSDGCPAGFGFRFDYGHRAPNGHFAPSCYNDIDMTIGTDWESAREYCQERGADLVSIETEREQLFLRKILPRHPSKPKWTKLRWYGYWLSGVYDRHENDFIWFTTLDVIEFRNFMPGEPSNRDANAAIAMIETFEFKWDDSAPSINHGILCEIEPII